MRLNRHDAEIVEPSFGLIYTVADDEVIAAQRLVVKVIPIRGIVIGLNRVANDNGMVNEIEISDGSIFMRSANCPDKLCVKSGHISLDGESICCAPAGILIVVRSETGGEYDAVTK